MSENFKYTYSASTNEEVRKIREKYISDKNPETNLEKIKRLDKEALRRGTIVSLVIGIISCLILGAGMSCVLVWEMMAIGIVIGIIGMIGVFLTHPIYQHIIAEDREKIREEILKLCDDELNN